MAAKERLQVILELIASQYKREAKQAASATGQVADSAQKAGTAAGGLTKQWAAFKKLAVGGALLKLGNDAAQFAGQSIKAFSDLNESLNAVEVTYGASAEGIKQLGKEAARSLGLSNAEFNTFAVSFSAFAQQIAGDTGDVVGTVDTLTTRISDFASVMNLEVADAAEKFQSGLAGETEPLRKFGIDLSAAKVNAFALANGIWDGIGAMTESEKVQARYGSLMEQTSKTAGDFANTSDDAANKTRILNAELEDQKALLGEQLVPAQQAWLDLQIALLPAIGDVAQGVGVLSGNMTRAEAAVKKFAEASDLTGLVGFGKQIRTIGEGLETLDNWSFLSQISVFGREIGFATDSGEEFASAIDDMVRAMGLTDDEIRFLAGKSVPELMRQFGLTEEQARILEEQLVLIRQEINRSNMREFGNDMDSGRWSAKGLAGGLGEAGDAADDLGDEIQTATTRLEDFEAKVRSQVDPLFAYRDALKDQAEAQAAINEARDEFGEGSSEYLDALYGAADAAYDAQEAFIRFADESGLTRAEFESQLRGMAIYTEQQIDLILADFDKMNNYKFADKLFNLTVDVLGTFSMPGTSTTTSTTPTAPLIPYNYHGGMLGAGQTSMVGERNKPELFATTNGMFMIPGDGGRVFSNADARALINSGGGSNLTINMQSVEPTVDAQRVAAMAAVTRRMET